MSTDLFRNADNSSSGVGVFRTLASNLLERFNLGRRSGVTFQGKRDLYNALGYPDRITPEMYRAMFDRGGIAARLCRIAPRSTFRAGGEVYEDDNPETITQFEQAWSDLNTRLQVWPTLMASDVMAGVGRYSVILLGGLPGELNTPIESATPDDLKFLQVYAEADAPVQRYCDDRFNERFGQPEFYSLRRTVMSSVSTNAITNTLLVHWSRCIHVPSDEVLESPVFGTPRMQDVWNYLLDLMKISGGGAEAYWKRADQGLQVDVDPTMPIDPDPKRAAAAEQALEDQLEEYTHDARRTLLTRGLTINPLGSDVADIKGPKEALMSLICATKGIPVRIFEGSERGELASTQDRDNWGDQIKDRRKIFAGPYIVRKTIDRWIDLGILPTPKQYEVEWPDIFEMTAEQKLNMAEKASKLNAQAQGVIITDAEIRETYLDREPLSEQEIAANSPEPLVTPDPTAVK